MTEGVTWAQYLVEAAARLAFEHQFFAGVVIGIVAGMLLERIHVIVARKEGRRED